MEDRRGACGSVLERSKERTGLSIQVVRAVDEGPGSGGVRRGRREQSQGVSARIAS